MIVSHDHTVAETTSKSFLYNPGSTLPKRDVVLELRREPLVNDVVGTLEVEILEGLRVLTQKIVRVQGEEGHTKKAAKVVNS
jgi:hypothetical protein